MAIQDGYNLIKALTQDTLILDIRWAVATIALALILIAITRDREQWKELAFPVAIGLHVAGIPNSPLIYIATGILYAIQCLSPQLVGDNLSAMTTAIPLPFGERRRHRKIVQEAITKEKTLREKRKAKKLGDITLMSKKEQKKYMKERGL